MNVKWRDPGPVRGGKFYQQLFKLKRYPGRWAEIGNYPSVHGASATASRLQKGDMAKPPGEFEFTSRTDSDGRGALFARYVPDWWVEE